ncbi:chromosome segregation protein SMC [Methylobacter sp.]|uniref:chromosome segregation protein SMC n=1 Tax=Methylobacter sp. TaxID=2051955 RepID=UPI002487F696|nr:chromosome segregation protein SMC [Methylobacter sp.]MDI1279078.1 chromosome segregation protein SMC [Methylobacter sp.]MDI1359899.1 chromosome segregation protein SMC [Methylobacter sp.]
MKLEKIKLSGFKSFVDPTVIPISGNLTAIVGPNGCGKSNIIDAVRWVMGESSAKHLRGGSMADVIFNGSSGRKPVSTASVELVFNNTDSKLGGEYSQYDTIAIKRQVSRDGTSVFMLNGSRCRRKDITDIFLGTGLGSRSYAIIEQGTISRMVEAKPDDLRVHIEEAAGVSKYKERRSETETRMKHTRENLERLDDLRDEVEKQIKHLQKQAEKAEKYTELKKQERQYRLELLAMRWNTYHQAAKQLDAKLQEVAHEHNRLFVELRDIDNSIEAKRADHKAQQQQTNSSQGDYYQIVAEVSGLEQTIKHSESSREQTIVEINRLRQQADQSLAELEADVQQLEEIKAALFEAEEALIVAEERQEDVLYNQQEVQQQKSAWQEQWETYRTTSSSYKEQAEVQRVKTVQLENQNRQLQIRLDKLHGERSELESSDLQSEIESLDTGIEIIETQRADLHQQLEDLHQQIREQRQQIKQYHDGLHTHRSEMQSVKGKITSLELLQQHAMGKDNKHLSAWLESVDLAKNRRLAEFLDVQAGWDTAVETVLGSYLEAICIESADQIIPGLQRLTDESVMLVETGAKTSGYAGANPTYTSLLDKVKAPWDLSNLLAGVYCVDDAETARTLSVQLKPHESVITPDGTWFGSGWIKIIRAKDSKTGVLQREKELRLLKQRQEELHIEIEAFEDQLETAETGLKDAEVTRESIQQQDNSLGSELSAKSAEFSAHSARLEHQQCRLEQVCNDIDELSRETADNAETIAEYQLLLEQAEQSMEQQEQNKHSLEALNQELQSEQQRVDQSANEARQQVYSIKAQIESLRSSETLTGKQLERLRLQHQQSVERIAELELNLHQTLTPMDEEKKQLEQMVVDKEQLETRLKKQRQLQEDLEAEITRLSEEHIRVQRALEKQKEALDTIRFELQESKVRQQTVNEQLKEIDADVEQVLQSLPEQAEENSWKRTVDDLLAQIERLGTINLTAIEEYKAQSERMNFLNEQHADLIEALQTLDQAISKIDKESRLRFKETFDKINTGLQEKFPKLFGGGHAYLELTEQDELESGVNIIARPPGKKNSSIHLLSGGEKALTAVALVFSIFELNPAPFCLLDEVDAPLDDANVGRFSKMVEEMSASVQFLYISHNKVTMEIAKQLAGVTMKEPGVSRMVAVDIEEAVSLAEI